ncbi:YkoP family protein [Brevibacillus massiliensis]|jgi:hypothetical protein|uniref:YkoP family protein n=1 Tax=Brevibacillus massiliensis TaxID=1118054 RepID=UPI000370FE69|nr:hypothetical protein [Brevibacillus massiliensis]
MNSGILVLWGIWDTLYHRCTRLQYVDKGRNIFRYVLLRYQGELLITADQQEIGPGDLILKLHIHNYLLAKLFYGINNDVKLALLLRRYSQQSLPQLAKLLAEHPRAREVKGIVGTTLLYRGVEPFGFSVSDVPINWFFRYKRWYLKLMLSILHPEGRKRVRKGQQDLALKRVYISKDELLRRYLPAASEVKVL